MKQETEKLYSVFKKYKGHDRIDLVTAIYYHKNDGPVGKKVVDIQNFKVDVRAKYNAEHIMRMISLRVQTDNVSGAGCFAEVMAFGGYRNLGGGMYDISEDVCTIS